MVLEILLNPKKAQRHPIEIMILSIFYSSISILISNFLFPEFASIFSVFLIVLSCFYITQGIIKREEIIGNCISEEKNILKKHIQPIKLFLFLFIGIFIAFAFWTFALPSDQSSIMFNLQEKVLNEIIDGPITGNVIKSDSLKIIFSNNLKVLLISLLISLIYGAGAIFVVAWNASIIGFLIGSLIKQKGISFLPQILTKYFLHGIPEIISYLIIILAGGIIYISLFNGNLRKEKRSKKTFLDTVTLIGISMILMGIASLIEVFISPHI